jgi:hypothetical protein
MKTPKMILLLTVLGAAALLSGGCVSVPTYAGDLYYYDAGCTWWWREGLGWRYAGFFGKGTAPSPSLHHPPAPGCPPIRQPGCPAPGYFFFGQNGTVLASDDGKSFHDIGILIGSAFMPHFPGATPGRLARYDGGFGPGRKAAAGGTTFHLAARPAGETRSLISHALRSMSNSAITHPAWGSSDGVFRNSGDRGGWGGGGSNRTDGDGGWRGGGDSGRFSGGGLGGGGGDRGGGDRGDHPDR